MRLPTRLISSATLLLALFFGVPRPASLAGAWNQEERSDDARDLRDLFETGYILQDRNGDDVVDFVNVRIVLPDPPGEADLAAAANIAARLGFETSAMNMDLTSLDSERIGRYEVPVVAIGAGNELMRQAGSGRAGAPQRLAPGQGGITFIPADRRLTRGGIRVEGYDATGLLEAAAFFAARYPAIWDPEGKTFGDVGEQLAEFLDQRAIGTEALELNTIVVDAKRPGVSRLAVTVRLADAGAFDRALAALQGGEKEGAEGRAEEQEEEEKVEVEVEVEEKQEKRLELPDLVFAGLHRIDITLQGPERSEVVRLRPGKPWQAGGGGERTAGASPDFTLSDIYSIRGLFRDTNRDFVPDDAISHLSLSGTEVPEGVVNLAARAGLETAGIRLPFVSVDDQDDRQEAKGFPIIYGIGHYQTLRLREEGLLYGRTGARGEGFIQFVPGAFGDGNGIVIGAGDAEGLAAISDYVAKRMPYLWEYGKGRFGLRDIETDVRRFFQVRQAPGQIAFGIQKLKTWLERLGDREIERLDIELAAKERPEGLDRYLERVAKQYFPGADVSAATFKTGFGVGTTIFEQDIEIPWEVDAFRELFRFDALPHLGAGSRGRIEVRVSESPEVRARLAEEIRGVLEKEGIGSDGFEIVVLSAYKQGYSWLYDEVLPRIRGRDVAAIEITYHTLKDSKEVRWQTINADTRWLQELFPIDAVLARELGIPDSVITFSPTRKREPIYTVRVLDRAGAVIVEDAFSPKYVVRPFFDLFPEYEQVRVTTGWVTVEANGFTILNERIKTDPEAFWEILQTDTYRRIVDYVMDVQEGRPSSSNAPYFDELRVELTLSEPNYRIGIDEEVISSTEALHEDIYFETLTLFNLIGGRYQAGPMDYAGRVLPLMKPPVDGGPGRARITFTGKERGVPELVLTFTEKGEEPVRRRYALSTLAVEPPKLRGISVRAGEEGLSQLLFEVTASDSLDRYEEFRERSSEAAIDRSFLSVQKLADMVGILGDLHGERIMEQALSWDRAGELLFRFTLEDSTTFTRLVSLPRSRRPAATTRPVPYDPDFSYRGERIVQWDTPISPEENEAILARLNTFPGVNVYYMATSFLGRDIFAVDVLPPMEAEFVSQAKLNALKPTLFLSGRQHANEVSSTSHILRLAELLATDPGYRDYLKNVNVVLHPITNADGAALDVEMLRDNPDFMLHAAYLGALGVDATSQSSSPDPIYPEARVRPEIREMWLPDIYLNLHGYPSHEWVQYFAGYSAWVRSRRGGQRSWWSPRGWFIPGFSWIDDEEYPEIQKAQFAILDSIAAAITALPEVEAMNRSLYTRYRKYGRQDRENFREYFYNGILVNMAIKGRKVSGSGVTNPRVTYFAVTTEAPDETARGDWLKLVSTAGLAHTTAVLRYLNDGENRIERKAEERGGFITRRVSRKKPVLPPER